MLNEKSQIETLKAGLLLLGSFAFAYNMGTIFHELGHAVFAYCSGGSASMKIHPFSWSYTYYTSVVTHSLLSTWAGVGLGSIFALTLFAIVWKWRSPYTIFLLMIGVVECTTNGTYFVIDSLLNSGGDASVLIYHGTPILLTIALGLIMIGIGIFLAIALLPIMGFSNSDGVKKRLLVFSIGILPYLLAMFIYHYFYNTDEIGLWAVYIALGIAIIVALSFLSALAQKRIHILKRVTAKRISWPAVILNNVVAIILLTVLFLLLQGEYSNDSQLSDVRPEDFPEILVVHDYAENAGYYSSLDSRFLVSYDVNVNCIDSPDEVHESINDILILNGCLKLKYSLFDPNTLNESGWKHIEVEFRDTAYEIFRLDEQWLKIDNEKSKLIIIKLNYSLDLETKELSEMSVRQFLYLINLDLHDYLSKYRKLHPNELKEIPIGTDVP